MARWLSGISRVACVPTMIRYHAMIRFRLRTFMLAMLVAALAVGLTITIVKRRAERRAEKRDAIDALAAEKDGNIWMFAPAGKQVIGSDGLSPEQILLHDLDSEGLSRNLPLVERVRSVECLDLSGSMFASEKLIGVPPNSSIRRLALRHCWGLSSEVCHLIAEKFPCIQELNVADSDIDKGGLNAFADIATLKKLDVSWTSVSISNLMQACLLFPQLEHLVIEGANLSGRMKEFCVLDALVTLDVSESQFSENDLRAFLECTGCREVIAFFTLNPSELIAIGQRYPHVRLRHETAFDKKNSP